MYIIIYIVNYNEYIVIYNIESHSLTITSTTWLNNVPHWYTNCKCTDKKALDEVQWGIEGGGRTHSARLKTFLHIRYVIPVYIYHFFCHFNGISFFRIPVGSSYSFSSSSIVFTHLAHRFRGQCLLSFFFVPSVFLISLLSLFSFM